MKFFFDNNLAAKIAKGLNGFVSPDHQVMHLKEQFAANTDDAVWMTQLAQQEDWVIIAANAVSLCLLASILYFKLREMRREDRAGL